MIDSKCFSCPLEDCVSPCPFDVTDEVDTDEYVLDPMVYEKRQNRKMQRRAYYAEHKEHIRAYQRAYCEKHKEKVKEYQNTYLGKVDCKEYREKIRAYQKAYYEKHKEKIRAYKKAYYQALKARNKHDLKEGENYEFF